jgi:nucleoside-diphosphate-sugar epimerase
MGKVFVCGASGWAGSEFVSYIKENSPSTSLIDIGGPCGPPQNARLLDLRFERAFEDFRNVSPNDVLVNFAGVIHPRTVDEFYTINADGLGRLFRMFAQRGGRRIVHISSNSVLGFNRLGEPFVGSSTPRPYLGYGSSKLIAEQQLLSLSAHSGVSCVVLRVPWFHGGLTPPPRQIEFYKMVLSGKFPVVGNGQNRRSVLNVRNLAICILGFLRDWHPGVYWLSDNEVLPLIDYLALIREVGGSLGLSVSSRPFVPIPSLVCSAARTLDAVTQALGRYYQKVHVLGELDQNIFGEPDGLLKEVAGEDFVPLTVGVRDALIQARRQGLLN